MCLAFDAADALAGVLEEEMNSSPYRVSDIRHLSEKSGTIDQVLWSAQVEPFKMVSVLTFTDGEEVASVAVDDTMLKSIEPGRSGTFYFGDAGGVGALVRVEARLTSKSADGEAWARAARVKFGQALAVLAVGVAFVTLFVFSLNSLVGIGAIAAGLGAIWLLHVGNCRRRISSLINRLSVKQSYPKSASKSGNHIANAMTLGS